MLPANAMVRFLNTRCIRNSTFVNSLRMEYVSKIDVFGLKLMVKSGVAIPLMRNTIFLTLKNCPKVQIQYQK